MDKTVRESTVHHSLSGMFAIRQGKWKLIDGLGDGGPEIGPARIPAQLVNQKKTPSRENSKI